MDFEVDRAFDDIEYLQAMSECDCAPMKVNVTDICVIFSSFARFPTSRWYDQLSSCDKVVIAKYFVKRPAMVSSHFGLDHLRCPCDS